MVLNLYMLIGAICDWRFYRIPNVLCLGIMATGLLFSYLAAGIYGIGQACIGMLIPLLLLYLLFYCGMLGAGDVKLLMAAGTFYWKDIVSLILLSFIFNAVGACIKIWKCSSFHERFYYFWGYIRDCQVEKKILTDYKTTSRERVHFSIGIFFASVTLFIWVYQSGDIGLLSGILK